MSTKFQTVYYRDNTPLKGYNSMVPIVEKRWLLFNMTRKEYYIGGSIEHGGVAQKLLHFLLNKNWSRSDYIIEAINNGKEHICYCNGKPKENGKMCVGCIDDTWKLLEWG